MTEKGRFIVFEGVDGSGKTTQIDRLASFIRSQDKYRNVLFTREPTSKARDIIRRLEGEGDGFTHGSEMARGYIEDRRLHLEEVVLPNLAQGVDVLCDRYALSTLAYQSTQGEDVLALIDAHRDRGIIRPDLTFYFDVCLNTAMTRIAHRGGKLEKFESAEFLGPLIETHRRIARDSEKYEGVIGKVVEVNGNLPIDDVTTLMIDAYRQHFDSGRTN